MINNVMFDRKSKIRSDLTGREFGKLKVLSYVGSKQFTPQRYESYWECECKCGVVKPIRYSHLINNQIVSCGCARNKGKKHYKWTGYGEITGTFFNNIKQNAKKREFVFEVSIEDIYRLFLDQGPHCALSGMSISLKEGTASLDRIDSSKGYVVGNLQWLHKDVNTMKNCFSEDYFISMCDRIAQKKISPMNI